MRVSVSWWDLGPSTQSIESLRQYLAADGVEPWAAVQGLRVKVWFADPDTNRWGGLMLWDANTEPADLPPNRATELIGYPPTERVSGHVEAWVEDGSWAVCSSDPREGIS